MSPSVSLAVMVKDDARRLKRCLLSLRGAVDEMLVLDTGSKDDTAEIAKEEGARVEHAEWTGSFSEGLNALLDAVRTDWVLRLDSDEWFDPGVAPRIRDLVEDDGIYAYRMTRRDLRPAGGYSEIGLVRLWRSHTVLRYHGFVHENIPYEAFPAAWPGKQERQTDVWFWHDGYQVDQLEKVRRNVPLLEKELAHNPEQPYFQAVLAKNYRDLEDQRWRPAMERIVDRALALAEPDTRMLAIVFGEMLEDLQPSEIRSERTERLIEKAWAWFGNVPSVLWSISIAESERGNRDQTLRALLALAEMAEGAPYDTSIPVSPVVLGHEMWKRLDQLADRMGRRDVCDRCEPHL